MRLFSSYDFWLNYFCGLIGNGNNIGKEYRLFILLFVVRMDKCMKILF